MSEEKGTRRTIYAALAANSLIAIAKFFAGFVSGSAAVLAEGVHPLADTTNQLFLLVILRLSESPPETEHPCGYGKDRFSGRCLRPSACLSPAPSSRSTSG